MWARSIFIQLLAAGILLAAEIPNVPNETNRTTQIWDYAEELDLNAAQLAAMNRLRLDFESAQSEWGEARRTDVPPDALQNKRAAYASRVRAINQQIGELLTDEQEKAFATLRSQNMLATRQQNSDETGLERSGFTRIPSRPELTPEEYEALAKDLRKKYSKAPTDWPAPALDPEVKPIFRELGLLPPVPYPTNNPYHAGKAELGKKLFFDPRLSGSGQLACASCHEPELGWSDGRTVSFGHSRKELKRNSPTLLNIGHSESLFWDGRADSLEQQVIDVVQNADEMRGDPEKVKAVLQATEYTNEFAAVFGTSEITLTRIGKAIATFERTITSRDNAFDSFLRGNSNALSEAAVRGLHLFRTTAGCANCHFGPNFTDNRFHNEGLTYYGRKLEDLGRYLATENPQDVGAFKTPTLRNITRTAPYMHNGLFDLDGVLNLYNAGMPNIRPKAGQENDPLFPQKSKLLKPLGLNKTDLSDLKAFLESLTETRLRIRPPQLPGQPE